MTGQPVLDMELRKKDEQAITPAANVTLMFERLASDPNVDVEKLERLIQMQERILAHNAQAAFNAAYSQMQSALPEISEHGKVTVKGVLRSTYARLEDIHVEIRPVLKVYGFAVRHRTEWPADKPGIIRIVGILSHAQGHSEESCFEAPMDQSDYRTDIQSMGSTVSYGRRYTTLDLLNIATRGQDNDGQRPPKAPPDTPEGYDSWLVALSLSVNDGLAALQTKWRESPKACCLYLTINAPGKWNELKTAAAKVKAVK